MVKSKFIINKIHLANVIGKDKLPLDQREKYCENIIDTVHKCATDPYKNHEWLESENPWQTLASMFELSAAMKVIIYNIVSKSRKL